MLFSHVKMSPLRWLHNQSGLLQEKTVWYLIGVYIINRTLHDRLEIRIFSSRVENISLVRCTHSWNIFQHSKRNFAVSARPCNILYVLVLKRSNNWKKYRIILLKFDMQKNNLAWNWCYIIALYIHLSAMFKYFER